MSVCVQRFRGLPGGAELLEQRYHRFNPTWTSWSNCRKSLWAMPDTSTDALWLTQRIATQIGFPAYVLLNLLASFKAVRLKPTELEAISHGIAHGNRIGLQATPLVTQK